MTTKKLTKLLALYLPYILLGLVATNFGEAWRLAEGKELGDKIMSMVGTLPLAFANPLPSLHPLDLLIGFFCGAGLRLAVYLRSKNAKKYRHGMEYGSARWGTPKDIEPFQAPKFADNIILTKTERLMMITTLIWAVWATCSTSASLPMLWAGTTQISTQKFRRRIIRVHGSWAARAILLSSPVMMAGIIHFITATFP